MAFLAATLAAPLTSHSETVATLRPPAVPLVACDPYFSIWSPADKLTDANTTHWTGKPQRLTSLIRIDGKAYRVMGVNPAALPALSQTSLEVLPTRTIYTFAGDGVRLTMTFMTADLPESIDLLSRPVTYLTYECRATDGKEHKVETSFDAGSELTVNTPDEKVVWTTDKISGLAALKVGSEEQAVLARKGDDVRINWGYFYIAAGTDQKPEAVQAQGDVVRSAFAAQGDLAGVIPFTGAPCAASNAPVSAIAFQFGKRRRETRFALARARLRRSLFDSILCGRICGLTGVATAGRRADLLKASVKAITYR